MIISDEIKQAVFKDYENGITVKSILAEKYGISPRSIGRIIEKYLSGKINNIETTATDEEVTTAPDTQDNTIKDNQEVKKIPVFDLYTMGGSVSIKHEFPFTHEEANTSGYTVSDYFKQFLDDLHRQADEIGAMCDSLQEIDTPYNLENNRQALVSLLARLKWFETDTASIKLNIHKTDT